jgi:TrmH family RNA methyltransferase
MMATEDSYRAVAYPAPEAMARVRIILVEPQHPGNIGASMRAMKTAGMSDLVLVRPVPFRESQDAWNLASGARDLLESARVVEDLDAAAEGIHWLVGTTNRKRDGVLDAPVPVREAARRLASIAAERRVGILFGREDFGLSSADLARCNQSVAIPVAEGMPPLNLSHAVQVMAQELFMAALDAPPLQPVKLAAVSEVEALLRRFAELFDLLGPDALSRPPMQVLASLRRAFSRIGLEARDVRTLHMVVRAMTRRLRGSG